MRRSKAKSSRAVNAHSPRTRFPLRFASCRRWRSRPRARSRAPMRNVIITGASRGLGLAMARLLAASGYSVIGIARRESAELVELMDHATPGAVHFRAFDLSDGALIP